MKTIKKILLVCSAALVALNGHAQSYYTQSQILTTRIGTQTLQYQCTVKDGFVYLYNKNNSICFTKQTYNGAPTHSSRKAYSDLKPYAVGDLLKSCLTYQEKQMMVNSDSWVSISLYFNNVSGKVQEVTFKFGKTNPINRLPPECFMKMELALKASYKIDLYPEARNYNYVFGWIYFALDPKELVETPTQKPNAPDPL